MIVLNDYRDHEEGKMSKSDCKDRLIEIINKVADKTIDFDKYSKTPLTGDEIGIADYQMAYIVLEIMQEFQVRFDAEDFKDYKFSTFESVVDIVRAKLQS